jgi:glycerol-3-phosphate O-acyltransferase
MISYDRLIDSHLSAQQILTGHQPKVTLSESINRTLKTSPNQLGNVLVKFLEPINLADYL